MAVQYLKSPAYAGMNRSLSARATSNVQKPRVCGDEPHVQEQSQRGYYKSPAYAGMNRNR